MVALFEEMCRPDVAALQVSPPLIFISSLSVDSPHCSTASPSERGMFSYKMESDRHHLFLRDNETQQSQDGIQKAVSKKRSELINKCQLRRVWRIRSLVDHVIRTAAFP